MIYILIKGGLPFLFLIRGVFYIALLVWLYALGELLDSMPNGVKWWVHGLHEMPARLHGLSLLRGVFYIAKHIVSEEPYYIYWVTKLVYQRFFGTQLFCFVFISNVLEKIGYQKTSGKLIL